MRYFFNIYDGFAQLDKVGTELPDLVAAQADAVQLVSELLTSGSSVMWDGEEWYIEVTTGDHADVVFTIRFSAKMRTRPTKSLPAA